MKYRPVLRKNPRKPEEPGKYYPNPVYTGKMNHREIAREISKRTALSQTDALAAIEALTDVIPSFLQEGYIIQLGELGTFRLTMEGRGDEKMDKVTQKSIRSLRVNFKPRPELKYRLKLTELSKERKGRRA
jgi:predicted histone-like DNA-binding protein